MTEREIPVAPPVGGVAFVALRVRDPQLSARWYGGALGFVPLVSAKPERTEDALLVLVQPTGGLVLVLQPGGERDDDEPAATLAQVGLRAESPEQVAAWAAHFDHLGLTHSGVVAADRGPMVTLPDPDGVMVTIVAEPG